MAASALAPSAAAPGVATPDAVQQRLNALVDPDRAPGALAAVRDGAGRIRTYTARVGDRVTGAKVPRDGQVRIGSVTKTFTTVVVLQLVGEGEIGLDDAVEKYLPGLVRGRGIYGRDITVRQLLQGAITVHESSHRPIVPRQISIAVSSTNASPPPA